MINLDEIHDLGLKIEELLRLQSYPIALKMLEKGDKTPKQAIKPTRDWGHHISFCQALALTRRQGYTIVLSKEDMWCFEPVVGLGFVEPPKRFLDGWNRYPDTSSSLKAGAKWAKNMPRFEYGKYDRVITAPLHDTTFIPDIFILYGEPAKMTQIMLAKIWLDGEDINTRLSSHAACVYYVVPTIKENRWNISLPCGGDLRRAACETNNMIFSAPIEVLKDLYEGLKAIKEEKLGLPLNLSLAIEYNLPESYVEIGKIIGMEWVK